jgi:alanine racemase
LLNYSIQQISDIVGGYITGLQSQSIINRIAFDTRQIHHAHEVMFVAMQGMNRDGHNYIKKAWMAGVRCFLIQHEVAESEFSESTFIHTSNALDSLQVLAAYHRRQFDIPVIGITGSNGKTIVKEWLYQLLSPTIDIAKSPKSYNSQLGVPMSLFTLKPDNQLAIFEAGISKKGEMEKLERMIRPTIGILTYMGAAHNQGFESKAAKIKEKLILFKDCSTVIYHNKGVTGEIFNQLYPDKNSITWAVDREADLVFHLLSINSHKAIVTLDKRGEQFRIEIPFSDDVYLHNAFTCITYLDYAGYSMEEIQDMMSQLKPLAMRMELKTGMFNSVLINDTYNSDINSIALAFAAARKEAVKRRMIFIVSDFEFSDNHTHNDYDILVELVNEFEPLWFIGVGETIRRISTRLGKTINTLFYHDTDSLLNGIDITIIRDSVVLLKGARKYAFEAIVEKLEQRAHEAELEINLSALQHNLTLYRSGVKPSTKVMVMIKASAYGSGSIEVARILQQQGVDYLSVAYIDEGIDLRKAGIQLPIMVMNSGLDFVERMVEYDLEPEIYAPAQLHTIIQYTINNRERIKCHLKLDTGMHRLGFTMDELPGVICQMKENPQLEVVSIFTHLAGSGESLFDEYTHYQARYFEEMVRILTDGLGIKPMMHLLNSSGIARFPEYQYEMVRLGIGMYGFDPSGYVQDLHTVMTLKARISRIKRIPAGSTVGYDRRWKAERESLIATVSIGYADGLRRSAGNGRWSILVHDQPAVIVGSVCMDMTMVDVTDIEGVKEGDEAIIFGAVNRADMLAQIYETIPYEVFTGISNRVKRTYILE